MKETTIQLNGQTYKRANGGCADCDIDRNEVQEGCFQVPKLTDGQGCGVNTCWKVVRLGIVTIGGSNG
jgi:hypothetical protein